MKTLLAALPFALLAPMAQAQSHDLEIAGNTSGQPSYNRYGTGVTAPYLAYQITVTGLSDLYLRTYNAAYDIYIYLYDEVFDPANPATNVVAGDDDAGGYPNALLSLPGQEAGRYTLVVTGWCSGCAGSFQLYGNGAVLGWGLSQSAQLDELSAMGSLAGRKALRLMSMGIEQAARDGLSDGAVVSTKGAAAPRGPAGLRVWGRIGASADTGGSAVDLSLRNLQLGGDYRLAPALVGGLALNFGTLSASDAEAAVSGEMRALQPYLGWQAGGWSGSASVVLGRISYDDLTTSGGSATARGDLRALTLSAERDVALRTGAVLTPFASLRAGDIGLAQLGGSLAAAGIPADVWFREASLGLTVSAPLGQALGKLSLAADHFDTNAPIALASGNLDQRGWSGRVGLGLEAPVGTGGHLSLELEAGGLGSDTRDASGRLMLGWRF